MLTFDCQQIDGLKIQELAKFAVQPSQHQLLGSSCARHDDVGSACTT
jgi:hypothetical protein